jgi:hypothetical protein
MFLINISMGIFGVVWAAERFPPCEISGTNLRSFMIVIGSMFLVLVRNEKRESSREERK